MKNELLQVLTGCILCFALFSGCVRSKPADTLQVQSVNTVTGGALPDYIIRVQSSNGDIQQVEATVKELLYNGNDHRAFDKKMTPFDIPLGPGDFAVRLGSPLGGPELRVQLLKEGNRSAGFIQAREVCMSGDGAGGFEVKGCASGLR